MISSINSNVITTIGNQQYGKTALTGKTSETKQTEEKTKVSNSNQTVSMDGDTVSISAEGAAYAEKAAMSSVSQSTVEVTPQTTGDSGVSAVSGTATDTALQAQTAIKTETDTAATDETSEESDTDDLSEYTESELEQMMYSGEITRQEYEDEMTDRNGVTYTPEETT